MVVSEYFQKNQNTLMKNKPAKIDGSCMRVNSPTSELFCFRHWKPDATDLENNQNALNHFGKFQKEKNNSRLSRNQKDNKKNNYKKEQIHLILKKGMNITTFLALALRSATEENGSCEIGGGEGVIVSEEVEDASSVLQYVCEHCGKQFPNDHILSIHRRAHTINGTRPYQCKFCDKAFSGSHNLIKHIRTHTGEKPYACCICSKAFADAGQRKVHMRTHTGEKPFECELCGKMFSQSCNLRSHMATHSGIRPYHCPHCLKDFARASTLLQHKFHNQGQNGSLECPFCDQVFEHKCSLSVHLRTHPRESRNKDSKTKQKNLAT